MHTSRAVLTSTLPMLSLVLFWVLTLERIQARVAGARPMSQALSLRWCHTGKVLPLPGNDDSCCLLLWSAEDGGSILWKACSFLFPVKWGSVLSDSSTTLVEQHALSPTHLAQALSCLRLLFKYSVSPPNVNPEHGTKSAWHRGDVSG